MELKTKNKTIVLVLSALAIISVLACLFFIFKNKQYDSARKNQNHNNGINNVSNGIDGGSEETKMSFSSESKSSVYKIRKDDKWVYIINGQESEAYDEIGSLAFGLDGEKIAFSGILDGQTYIVIDGVPKGVPYEKIISIVFSPDGNRIAYIAEKEKKFVAVLDDKISKVYDEIGKLGTKNGLTYLVFSPDSQQIAFKVVVEEGSFVVVNQQEGKVYSEITNFQFSDDSKQFSYQAEKGEQQITVINNSKEIINNNNGTQYTNPTSTIPGNYKKEYINYGSKGTGELYSGGYDESLYQISCKGSNAVADCRK